MLESVEWGEFRIEDIFDSFNGDFDIKKEHVNGLGNYVITAGMSNNGILGKTDVEAKIFPKNTITVDMFGTAFYRDFPYKMVTHARVFCLKANIEINAKQGLFLSSSLHFLSRFFGYENMCSWAKIKNKKIQLPIKNSQLALDFMENFVAELEARRSAELEAYLSAAGLKDYTLTAEEQQALAQLECNKTIFSSFSFDNVFDQIKQGRRLKKDDQIAGHIPFVMAGVTNTGVVGYIANPVARFPKNSITLDIFGNAFYRNYNYGAGDDTGVYWNSERNFSKEIMLFLTTSMQKAVEGQFSYGKKLRSSQSLKIKMQLPQKHNSPDYAYMQTLLSAVQ
ncbi:restriction endonuclease subunit S [Neisseria sp. 74A18]|uniref:restriction endonuclease subunit S n=1 Tax=Neisseria sp. 74A18 TaxID=1696094 RepID=UPI000B169F53|nr:restriction endonuclease subunit S [Neisseria sp. 74A18]